MPDAQTIGAICAERLRMARAAAGTLPWLGAGQTVEGIINTVLAEQQPSLLSDNPAGDAKRIPPTADQVTQYARSIGFDLNGQEFCDFYESKGWVVGKTKMKNWQAAVRTWKRSDRKPSPSSVTENRSYSSIG